MKAVALLVLVSFAAWADDAPRRLRAFPVSAGYVTAEPGWFYTDEGKAKVDAYLLEQGQKLARLDVENASLRASLLEMEKKPALTAKGAAILVALGATATLLVVGAIAVSRR